MTRIPPISMRETLHYLGWRGSRLEPELLEKLQTMMDCVRKELTPHVALRRFALEADGCLRDTVFTPKGEDIGRLLASCDEAILMAATLGAGSERLLLKQQARSSTDSLLLDAVLSAAIETVCDAQENALRKELEAKGLYLTDRFSPGYGDMPLAQSREICEVLQTQKTIGLTVSESGIMIPRKSVSAIMGISKNEVKRRPSPCAICSMRETCALREMR